MVIIKAMQGSKFSLNLIAQIGHAAIKTIGVTRYKVLS